MIVRTVVVLTLLAAFAAGMARAADDPPEYELRTSGAVTAVVGQKGAASLAIVPATGRRLETGAPVTVRMTVAPATGLKLAKKRLSLDDAADPRAEAPRFDLPFTADAVGSYKIVADVRFWICAARTCRPVRDRVEIEVTVAAPEAPRSAPTTPTPPPATP